ncbi:hypothetical protein BG005_001662 [Podila minutissima]|nr:hypothetical protein BG005_001662 [Podila minutissima]
MWHRRTKELKTYDYSLEILDNPALAALIEYKWNTIGFKFWLIRFFLRCIYYAVVLVAVFSQIYRHEQRYSSDTSDISLIILNSLATGLGLVALMNEAIHWQNLIVIREWRGIDNTIVAGLGDLWIIPFSFSVPLIALQLFFELRVNKAMCKFVTIIQGIIFDIRIFFLVFVVGNLAFATAILHMLHGCSFYGFCTKPDTEFPTNFFNALTSTFFFMVGRFDPISTEFRGGNAFFLIMMLFYLFFHVIILVNVLIVWQKTRMNYIEQAETSYSMPRWFPKQEDIFPDEIYYTVTPAQRRAYEKRWQKQEEDQVDDFDIYGGQEEKHQKDDPDPKQQQQQLAVGNLVCRVEKAEATLSAAVASVAAMMSTDRAEVASLKQLISDMNANVKQFLETRRAREVTAPVEGLEG